MHYHSKKKVREQLYKIENYKLIDRWKQSGHFQNKLKVREKML